MAVHERLATKAHSVSSSLLALCLCVLAGLLTLGAATPGDDAHVDAPSHRGPGLGAGEDVGSQPRPVFTSRVGDPGALG